MRSRSPQARQFRQGYLMRRPRFRSLRDRESEGVLEPGPALESDRGPALAWGVGQAVDLAMELTDLVAA
jgi:hypothetical protein